MDLRAEQSRRQPLDHAPFPGGDRIKTRTGGQPTGPLERVTSEQLDRVSTHPDGLLAEAEYDLGVLMRGDPVELLAG